MFSLFTVMDVKLEQYKNGWAPIVVTLAGISMLAREHQVNALSPMLVNCEADIKDTLVKLLHS